MNKFPTIFPLSKSYFIKMQDNDDIVLVIVDDTGSNFVQDFSKSFPETLPVIDLIENAEKYGEHIEMNLYDKEATNEDNYTRKNRNDDNRCKQRYKMANPSQRNSLVKLLIKNNPELAVDEEKLVEALARIMSDLKPPSPPRDYFLINQDSFECAFCGTLTKTEAAAARHYRVMHGERYLVCYACGVDFRCNTNLYKHEKRCIAPDAQIVLRARALHLGRMGRNRPFLTSSDWKFSQKSSKGLKPTEMRGYRCNECSLTLRTAASLQSHKNLHKGLRPHSCPHCPSRYASMASLCRHLKVHSSVQMICDQCGSTFKVKSALVAHMETHAPMRKYGCVQCPRRFAQKRCMEMHVNCDHKQLPPPYACLVCHKRYTRPSLLKKHLNDEHDLQLMTRNMYFKALPKMSESDAKTCAEIIFHNRETNIVMENEEIKDKTIDEFETTGSDSVHLNETIEKDSILVHSENVLDLNNESDLQFLN